MMSAPAACASATWSSVSTSTSIFNVCGTADRALFDCLCNAPSSDNVIVLDQHAVVKPEAVVMSATEREPHTFVATRHPAVVFRVSMILTSYLTVAATNCAVRCSSARKALQKIESNTFTGEDRFRAPFHRCNWCHAFDTESPSVNKRLEINDPDQSFQRHAEQSAIQQSYLRFR